MTISRRPTSHASAEYAPGQPLESAEKSRCIGEGYGRRGHAQLRWKLQFDDSAPDANRDRLGSIRGAQFLEYVPHVDLHGVL
jgi:hypothetical protein